MQAQVMEPCSLTAGSMDVWSRLAYSDDLGCIELSFLVVMFGVLGSISRRDAVGGMRCEESRLGGTKVKGKVENKKGAAQ